MAVLRVRLEHAAEENQVLQQKVKLSDEIANRWADKYAELTKGKWEVAVRNAKLLETQQEITQQQKVSIKEQAELVKRLESLLREKDHVIRQLTDTIKEEQISVDEGEKEINELREKLVDLERLQNQQVKNDFLKPESFHNNPQSYDSS